MGEGSSEKGREKIVRERESERIRRESPSNSTAREGARQRERVRGGG